jgi:hypothetical protein
MILNQDFKEFIALLSNNGVKYLIVGAYAVGYYGYPRYTKDLDIWIQPSPDNALKMMKTLDAFGFASLKLTQMIFLILTTLFSSAIPRAGLLLLFHVTACRLRIVMRRKIKPS